MAINKVTQNNNTVIDLTSDTVSTATVKSGVTLHLPNGQPATGSMNVNTTPRVVEATTSAAKRISFNVLHEPSWFMFSRKGSVSQPGTDYIVAGVQTIYEDAECVQIATMAKNYLGWTRAKGSISEQHPVCLYTYSNNVLTIEVESGQSYRFTTNQTYRLIYI